MPIIDMHTHALSKRVEPLVAGHYDPMDNPYRRDMSPASRETDAEQGRLLPGLMLDIAKRREMMAKMGVDFQVIAPAPAQQNYWADEDLQCALSRVQNEDIAALVAQDPAHFAGMGTLPMRFPGRAVEEAVHAVEQLGLRGFQIDTRVENFELSHAAFDPLYARLANLRIPLFVHPLGFSHGQRLGDFFMVNSVGQPIEETIAIAHFIMGGILDRHPDLDVVIAHGGGFYPFYAARLDHAWKVRPEVRRLTADAPSTYLKRLWFDTCVFSAELIDNLIKTVGLDRVMMGSDYPFDMGDPDPVGLVNKAKLSDTDRQKVLFGNASRLFKIG
ncbi:amidohydrolase family protein [Tardiphaga sp. 866_E4_N2_1]|uniref:amidohydrolase family protein n=1 Tax=unclassified Tardiphaga TaxID=2631404 RepID=UPI0008A8092F|nr:amidohydrolase family protein [Tardiphaga sp. OK245]SEH71519.1 aminocarboxymuconate-semialdehyde decarboxylase [Tardiphaga sp. OK245]